MSKITREQFLNRLETSWQTYPERFHQLSPEEQKAYLEQQGYATFPGLLSHVVAWWQDGAQVIERMRADPAFTNPDYDVDTFNAQSVAKFSSLPEPEMLHTYEAQRQAMCDLVTQLTDEELNRESINRRLYYEIIYHWTEHHNGI